MRPVFLLRAKEPVHEKGQPTHLTIVLYHKRFMKEKKKGILFTLTFKNSEKRFEIQNVARGFLIPFHKHVIWSIPFKTPSLPNSKSKDTFQELCSDELGPYHTTTSM